jgi:hypothetical protein
MKNIAAFQNVTPGAKLAMVNNKLGNPSLKRNQGSSVEIWDYVKITPGAAGVVRFFDNVNTKVFPFSNIQQAQLQTGESLAVQFIAFTRITVKAGAIQTFEALTDSVNGLSLAGFSFLLDNSRIIKNNSLVRSFQTLNTKGGTALNSLFYPDTDLTIPPQISFTGELNLPANTDTGSADTDVYYGMHLFGTGAILNLKANV